MNETELRAKQITRTSIIGIIANLFLAGFKAIIGLVSGSIAVVLDAVNNLTDAMSSVITIAGIKLSRMKPSTKYPYGHGRVEYFSSIVIAAIVLAAGILSFIESVKKIVAPEVPQYSVLSVVIIVVAIVVKLLLGTYVKKKGKQYNSDALIASGTEASFDAIVSAATLLGAVITLIFHITIDGYIGAVISVLIAKTGAELMLESVSNVMGRRADSEITKSIKATVRGIDGVLGAYDLILHDYGPDSAIGSIHVEIPYDMTADAIHKLTKEIELTVQETYHVTLTVGIYSVDRIHAPQRKTVYETCMTFPGVLGTHGVYIDDEKKYMSFDALTDFTVTDKPALHRQIEEKLKPFFPGYTITVNFDVNYSD